MPYFLSFKKISFLILKYSKKNHEYWCIMQQIVHVFHAITLYTQTMLELDNCTTLLDVIERDYNKLNKKLSALIFYKGIPKSSSTKSCQRKG